MKMTNMLCAGACVFLLPLFYSGCDEESKEDKLPPISLEGRHTFGCLVDGQIFKPRAALGHLGLHADLFTNHEDTVEIAIYAENYVTDQRLTIYIFDSPTLVENKDYDLTDPGFHVRYIDYVDSHSCSFETVKTGTIKLLKFDPMNSVVAGTFEIELQSDGCNRTVMMEEGRFDIGHIDQ